MSSMTGNISNEMPTKVGDEPTRSHAEERLPKTPKQLQTGEVVRVESESSVQMGTKNEAVIGEEYPTIQTNNNKQATNQKTSKKTRRI